MTSPTTEQLFSALDTTWAAARFITTGPWTVREGKGGGQRVSAATANSLVAETDIDQAEAEMRGIGQTPLFMIRPQDKALDQWLDRRGYTVVDPVNMYVVRAEEVAEDLPMTLAIPTWPLLAIQRELWAAAGIGPDRIAVMERVSAPKISILGRRSDTPGGTAFVAADHDIAMLHALEVAPSQRRKKVAETVMRGAANWAIDNGATWLAVAVTQANAPANGLYDKLGMTVVTKYHYRRAPTETV